MSMYMLRTTSASSVVPHHPTRRTRQLQHRHHSSPSQRGARVQLTYHRSCRPQKLAAQPHDVAPYVLKAETACISSAFCLQLLSLYLILHQVKQQVPLTESSPPAADNCQQDSNQLPATTNSSTDLQHPEAAQADHHQDLALEATHHSHRVSQVAGGTRGHVATSVEPAFLTPYDTLACTSWLSCLQGVLLCAALLCNAFIRRRQATPKGGSAASSAAAAAAQLVRLEAVVQQHTAQLAAVTPQVEKLGLRARVTSAELKQPLRQLQAQVAVQAGVMAQLADEQEKQRKQAEEAQLLMAALQGVVAKQFGVLVDAIKQLKQREGRPAPTRQQGGPALRQALPSSGLRT